MSENCKAEAKGWTSIEVSELTRLRAIVARVEDIEKVFRSCNVEIIPLKNGGWEIYADYGENSGGHIKSDSNKSLWDVLLEIDNPFHKEAK